VSLCSWLKYENLETVTGDFRVNPADLSALFFLNPFAGYYSPAAGASIQSDPHAEYIKALPVQVCKKKNMANGMPHMLFVTRVGPILLPAGTAFDISFIPAAPRLDKAVYLVEWFEGGRDLSGQLATYPPVWVHHSQTLQTGVELPKDVSAFTPLTAINDTVRFRGFQKPSNAADYICEAEDHPLRCAYKRMPTGMGLCKAPHSDLWSQARYQNVGTVDMRITLEFGRQWAIPGGNQRVATLFYAYFSISSPLAAEYLVLPLKDSVAWRTFVMPSAGFITGTALHTHAQQAQTETWVLNASGTGLLPASMIDVNDTFNEVSPSVQVTGFNLTLQSLKDKILSRSIGSLRTIFKSRRAWINGQWYVRGAVRLDSTDNTLPGRGWSFQEGDSITLIAFIKGEIQPAYLHSIVGAFLHFY